MKIIKSVSIFVLLFLGILFLSGCGKQTVSISFEVDGGSLVQDLTEIDLDEDFILPKTEKANYVFLGWFVGDKEMTEELIKDYFKENTDLINISLKAKWTLNKYNVKFYDGDVLIKEEIVEFDANATAPVLDEKQGYVFNGWDSSFLNVREDLIVSAEWEKLSYSVKYVDYDGNILKEASAEYNQELINLIPPLVNREGYEFIGWDRELPDTMPNKDLVLVAEYSINQYSIMFDENGGSIVDVIVNDFGYLVNKPINPIKEGYLFVDWYVDQDLLEAYLFSTMPAEDITLYAKWKVVKYKLIYLDDDLTVLEELYVEYNQDLNLITEPNVTRNGYSFLGWHQKLPSKMPANDIVMVAEFSINQYTISFNEKGGSKVGPIIQDFDTLVLEPESPTKTGFIFGGWYLEEDLVNKYTFSKMANENLILYAKWTVDDSLIIEFENYMLDNLNHEIENDISLPTSYSGLSVSWTTNNSKVITTSGKFNRPYNRINVNLTANLQDGNSTYTIIFTVTVKGYKVLEPGIASSYIYRQYTNVTDDYFEILDIINCAFITANSSGTLYGSTYLNNVSTYILPKAKQKGVWVLMSIAPESSWSAIAASPSLINTFANNIVAMINQYGFDGVDIDWETPTSSESESFVLLARTVNEKVKANNSNHLVTAAIGGGKWQPPRYNLKDSHQYLDYINMMTYGMVSENGYYQNALFPSSTYDNIANSVGRTLISCSIEESVAIYSTYNIPYEKIIVGAAFYGMKQSRTYNSSTQTWSGWVRTSSPHYHTIVSNYLNNSSYDVYFDDVAKVPYILKKDGTEFISFDNHESIIAKSAYILNEKLGGMMFWESGTDKTNTLIMSLGEGLGKI